MNPLTRRLSLSPEECTEKWAHCHCLFELWKRGEAIAACPTIEAHDAARRLMLGSRESLP